MVVAELLVALQVQFVIEYLVFLELSVTRAQIFLRQLHSDARQNLCKVGEFFRITIDNFCL